MNPVVAMMALLSVVALAMELVVLVATKVAQTTRLVLSIHHLHL
jgi:hypothetical protein